MSDGIDASALQNLQDLKTPPDQIKWRQGPGGKQLAYIDARYVMDVLDTLIGPANWQSDHKPGTGGITLGGIGIKIEGEWVWKWDGAGETDIEGEKGAVSDSFKRAAVKWGIARDLYAIKSIVPAVSSVPPVVPFRSTQPRQTDLTDGLDANDETPPFCPYHNTEALRSKYPDKQTGRVGWYCPAKAGNGSPENKRGYCGWTA